MVWSVSFPVLSFCYSVLFCRVFVKWLLTVCGFALWRISCTNLSARILFINCTTVNIRTFPAITQRCCYRALFFPFLFVCPNLFISFCAVMRFAKHFTIFYICRTAFTPSRNVVCIHFG